MAAEEKYELKEEGKGENSDEGVGLRKRVDDAVKEIGDCKKEETI